MAEASAQQRIDVCLRWLANETTCALLSFQTIYEARGRIEDDLAWLLQVTLARMHLVGSRVTCLRGLVLREPTPE